MRITENDWRRGWGLMADARGEGQKSMSFLALFANPTAAYRAKPFWAWNGLLEERELRRQVRIFQTMGMGGAFLHARVGLETRYLGPAWFDAVRAAVDECSQQGLQAWLYDEDRFPSGFAGGLCTSRLENRTTYLRAQLIDSRAYTPAENELAAWELSLRNGEIEAMRALVAGQQHTRKTPAQILRFQVVAMEDQTWFGRGAYLDTLSPRAVDGFIKTTHEAYRREIGQHFGKTVPGIFTDEPNCCFSFRYVLPEGDPALPRVFLPWTTKLPETFAAQFGYRIEQHLPELVFDVAGGNAEKTRSDYRNCVTGLFVNNYIRRVADWCRDNHLQLTGHVLEEESLTGQASFSGVPMRVYEHMHIPGIDTLGQFNHEYNSAKQCQSVLHQTGRTWMTTELYGGAGWEFTFEGHKAVGDWQAALGANLRCIHLSWYTMKGEAKRDFPASVFFQAPWWRHYRVVEDYFARIHVALTRGRSVQRLLVIHPIESMFARLRPPMHRPCEVQGIWDYNTAADIQALDRLLPELCCWLLEAHLDFDYGDEELIARWATTRVSPGGAPEFCVGSATYSAVLVPPLVTIRATTLEALDRFAREGGVVVFTTPLPTKVNATPSDAAQELAARARLIPFSKESVLDAVEDTVRCVSIRDADGREWSPALYQLRAAEGEQILFICNTDRSQGNDSVSVRIKARGPVVELDPESGKSERIGSIVRDGFVEFHTSLHPSGSRLFLLGNRYAARIRKRAAQRISREQPLRRLMSVSRTESNVAVLDTPRFRLGMSRMQGPLEILQVDHAARARIVEPPRSFLMLQPWLRASGTSTRTTPLELEFTFRLRDLPSSEMYLAMESPTTWEKILLNDHVLSPDDDCGWWVDPCFRRLPLDMARLVVGRNTIRLNMNYGAENGLEALYLLGEFELEAPAIQPVLGRLRHVLTLGDWTQQGFPFYGGGMSYRYDCRPKREKNERVWLQADRFHGAAAAVVINGHSAGCLAWPPYKIEITDHLLSGHNSIVVEVFGNRRNTFGPLHQRDLHPDGVWPNSFGPSGGAWSVEPVVRSSGLLQHPKLIYRVAEP